MALFGKSKKPSTANGALEYMIKNVKDGNVEEIMNVFNIQGKYRKKVEGLPGVLKGYLGTYGKKLFKQSEFRVGAVQMNGSSEAAVQVMGKTFDGKQLAEDALKVVEARKGELGILNGKKDLKAINQTLGLVKDVIDMEKIVPTKGVVTMVKGATGWEIKDRDEFTQVIAAAKASEMIPVVKAKAKEILGR